MADDSRIVYSTDGGKVKDLRPTPPRPNSRKPARPPTAEPADGMVRLRREKGGRGGKVATTITGLPGTEPELDTILKQLKQHLGTGGSRTGRTLELQGDHRERLQSRLESLGHRVKLAGG